MFRLPVARVDVGKRKRVDTSASDDGMHGQNLH